MFACGDEIPLKLVKTLIFYDQDCLRNRSFWIYARKNALSTKIMLVEIKKNEFSNVFNTLEYLHFVSRLKFHFFGNVIFLEF